VADLGLVVFGDVIDSRLDGPASARWLRRLADELDDAYGEQCLAPFGFTQGDELQGVLQPSADPFAAVLRVSLRDEPAPEVRWAIAAGPIEPGEGPATQWTGPAFLAARQLIDLARRRRDRLVARSADPASDVLLDDVAPVLGLLLAELTDSQRRVARLLLLEGLRQADAAERLGIARPTVSVAAERAHVRDIERLDRVSLALLRQGIRAAAVG
jgi:predicted DNA-binding protein (UPF0251 family)